MHEIAHPSASRAAELRAGEHQAGGPSAHQQHSGDIERLALALFGGALAIYGLRQGPRQLPLTLLGGFLAYRGLAGMGAQPIHIEQAITIDRPPAEVFRFWRDLRNLPQIMQHIEAVTVRDPIHSHWVARGPAGTKLEWDAEIFFEKPQRLIAWRSLPGAPIPNAGSVRFIAAPAGDGCIVRVVLEYVPPAGQLGRAMIHLLGENPGQQILADLRQLKQRLETSAVSLVAREVSNWE